eukprot:3710713-Lingulodinium_polyedra.AAC.1
MRCWRSTSPRALPVPWALPVPCEAQDALIPGARRLDSRRLQMWLGEAQDARLRKLQGGFAAVRGLSSS